MTFCHRFMKDIHAPARGATRPWPVNAVCVDVSIHAPTRGATLVWDIVNCHGRVSIHAPTRVGNIGPGREATRYVPVHPHTCGEHVFNILLFICAFGSSPHVWGT